MRVLCASDCAVWQLPNFCSVLLIALYFLLGVAGFVLAMLGGAYLTYMKK